MINEQGANSVGKKVENFIGKDDKEVFRAELANKVRALDKKVFDGSAYNGEEAVDEDTIFYSHKFIIEDPETGERVLAGISTDISKFNKTERELFDVRLKAEDAN